MKRPLPILCALILLAGCGGQQAALNEQVEAQAADIKQLEATVQDLRETHRQEKEALRNELTEAHQRELDDVSSTLRRQVNEHSRTIATLREALAAVEQPPEALPAPVAPPEPAAAPTVAPTPTISVYTPPATDLSEFLEPPTNPDADLFPVRIESVRGEQIVVGSHMTTRMVESGEVVKDKYGEEKPVMVPEQIDMEDYDTQATFTAENVTRNPVTLTYRAGRKSQTVTVESGATVSCKVLSRVGASLTVNVDGESRSFPVPYP